MTHKQNKYKTSKNNAAIAKPADDKNVIMLYITQFITIFTTSKLL